jgi:perosamine synthetase
MISLYKPYMPAHLPEINNILHSGALAYGKWGKAFEEKLATFIGNEKILVVNSYNSAVLVALSSMGIVRDDEVIASPMSCLASNQPLVTQGAKVVWADIDPLTGTLDPESVRSKITHRTKAIFHNHHCGYPGYIDAINQIGKEFGIYVVDDAIEAFGATYAGKKVGNNGADITLFSFQTVRLPNTIDGGGLSFGNQELYQKSLLIRDLGVDRRFFRDETGEISANCDIQLPGFGATLNEVSSYIGLLQINEIEPLLTTQAQNALFWQHQLEGRNDLRLLQAVVSAVPNYWVFGILANNKMETIQQFRAQGYYASGVHLNNNLYSVFNNSESLPGVTDFYNRFVALPSGWWIHLEK